MIPKVELMLVEQYQGFIRFAVFESEDVYCTVWDGSIQLVHEAHESMLIPLFAADSVPDVMPKNTDFNVYLHPEEKINFDLRVFFKCKRLIVLVNQTRDKWGYVFYL
jgi:hypothetical protein